MLGALFGTRQETSSLEKEKHPVPPLLSFPEEPTIKLLTIRSKELLTRLASVSKERAWGALRNLDERVMELLQIWEFMANAFPENSPRYHAFMDLNRQMRECYYLFLNQFREGEIEERKLFVAMGETHQRITTLVEPQISKRIAGLKPLHRLAQHIAASPIEQAQLEKWIERLIKEGANPKDRTTIYKRGFFRALLDALLQFPWVHKMYRAFFDNPKRDVFGVSQSSDTLDKVIRKHQTVIVEVRSNRDQESLPMALLSGVRNVLDFFSTPIKLWGEQRNPSYAIAKLIGLHEELLGQRHLQQVHDYLLAQDREITGNFFRIISDFKKSSNPNRFQKVNDELKHFFAQLGIDNMADVFFNIENTLDRESVKNSLEIQILYYLIAYVYKTLNVNRDGTIVEKYQQDYEAQVEKCLKILEAVNFSPAFAMHTKLNTVDLAKTQQISLQGALLGNRQCQYTLCGHYFTHLTGTLAKASPPVFDFPQGMNKAIIIAWAIAARDEGYTDGLAHMQNFMTNFFGAAGAYYQAEVSLQQKERIKEIAEVVKALSGDKTVNQFADTILNLQGEEDAIKAQYKAVLADAGNYLVSRYAEQFSRTQRSVDSVIRSSLMRNIFERHAVFETLSHIEAEMNREKEKLQGKGSETAEIYLYPLRYIRELKQDLVTETDKLRYLHTNDPDAIMQEAEKLLRGLYQNVKAKEEVSVAHKTSLRALKHTASKWVLHILPKEIAPQEAHRTKAIAASYNLYQAARKISAGKAREEQSGVVQQSDSKSPQSPRVPLSARALLSPSPRSGE